MTNYHKSLKSVFLIRCATFQLKPKFIYNIDNLIINNCIYYAVVGTNPKGFCPSITSTGRMSCLYPSPIIS